MVVFMDKQRYWRILRRIVTLLAVLIMLVACSAQVRAEGEEKDGLAELSAAVVEESGLTKENFSAVAVQLEAVARADGRLSADRMLYTAFSEAAALQVGENVPAAAESGINVIVVPEKKTAPDMKQLVPFFAVIAAAGVMLISVRRRHIRGTVYKPMRRELSGGNPYAGYGMVRTYR